MTDFTKTKMHFALALLGTLFAMHPVVEKWQEAGFEYLSHRLTIFYAYGCMAALLAVAIYCYAAALMSERPASRIERVGNYCYALSIFVFPLYGGLYLAHRLERWLDDSRLLADWLAPSQLSWVGPGVATGLGLILLVVWQVLGFRVRSRLGDQDRAAKDSQLAERELNGLSRSWAMFNDHHYDLSVVEAWKALEARLRRALLGRGTLPENGGGELLISAAAQAGILREPSLTRIHDVRRQWSVAVGTEPLTREPAEKALQEVRDILATISVTGPDVKKAA